ncbi:hypothetical protein IWQ57_000416 [Coemansia nantahalensis]|uniref:Uncharacterized protein n=1 Tax=Coemansia nantahalensis TaxID=2789366 RepID=A0ACC1K7M8_9FUNG|nr:hypothetical protein IWQ57_000416 [Coemansia nantahalensis]
MFSRHVAAAAARRTLHFRRFTGAHHPSASAASAPHTTATTSSMWTNPDPGSEFSVMTDTGFLPRRDPLAVLPSYFEKLDEILHEMPINRADGTLGLLHTGRLGARVERELPHYDVEFVFDQRILTALYRDYSMLASAYLFEPCDIQFRLARNYGLARHVLPANIAVPLETIARRLGQKPFLEHSTFTLYNYRRRDASKPVALDNLEPIRQFSGCDKEHNFVAGQVAAASHTGAVVDAALAILRSAQQGSRSDFNAALRRYAEAMGQVNGILAQTLRGCGEYASFRTFLSGSRAQSMFCSGVLFESAGQVSAHAYLGAAQSSSPVASLSTHLFQLSELSPRGSLRCADGVDRLRAPNHQSFLAHVASQARAVPVHTFALRDAESSAAYIQALGQVLAYRHRQWANLRDSAPVVSAADSAALLKYLDVQAAHVRDIAELIRRSHANTDLGQLPPALRARTEAVVHSAETVHRSLDRVLEDGGPSLHSASMPAY